MRVAAHIHRHTRVVQRFAHLRALNEQVQMTTINYTCISSRFSLNLITAYLTYEHRCRRIRIETATNLSMSGDQFPDVRVEGHVLDLLLLQVLLVVRLQVKVTVSCYLKIDRPSVMGNINAYISPRTHF